MIYSETVLHKDSENSYKVSVGNDCTDKLLPALTAQYSSCALISDSNVAPLWAEKVRNYISCPSFVFIPGCSEQIKSLDCAQNLWNSFCEKGINRKSCVIALGGGTVGDLSGFVASTYMRGIDLISLPTTLLAMTDSSVGGKTAINIPAAKNTVGTFYRPKRVISDTAFLETLPKTEYSCGMAEVIKYAFITENVLPKLLDKGDFLIEAVISECVKSKAVLVDADEFDTSVRMALNFGHTVGHAVEMLSKFSIPHGLAVAYGCHRVLKAAVRRNYCSAELLDKFEDWSRRYCVVPEVTFSDVELADVMLSDKKASSGLIRIVFPKSMGFCDVLSFDRQGIVDFLSGID